MARDEEAAFLAPFFEKAEVGGTPVVGEIKQAPDVRLGRKVAPAPAYNLLHRHGWRKLAPDKRHPKTGVAAQDGRKKLPGLLAETDGRWQGEGHLRLMFQDEARFGRTPDTRRCWCPEPMRPLCRAMVAQEHTYAHAAVPVSGGQMGSLILPHANGNCMRIFLDGVASRHPNDRAVVVLDGAGWHQSESLLPAPNLRPLKLPPYSPELDPVEHLWDDLREKPFHNRVFDSIDTLENHLEAALRDMETDHQRVHSIVAWLWIVNSLTI